MVARDRQEEAAQGRRSDFVAVDLAAGRRCELEDSRLGDRHAPWSTFKMPNLLIALETGAATGLDHVRTWQPALRPAAPWWPQEWREAQTLLSAFRHSVVCDVQEIAVEVGAPAFRDRLGRWS